MLHHENTVTILSWLDEHLRDDHSITALRSELGLVPQVKGLYFFFLRSASFTVLDRFIDLVPVTPLYTRNIASEEYHLVYIGSAGTGKMGGATLRSRLDWHLGQQHDKGAVCHGTLSTLRTGLASMIADDLILNDAEANVNKLLRESFKIFYLPYKNAAEIDNDERILIQQIRPLFNIKNNPNAVGAADDHPTKRYRTKRNQVIQTTRHRLGCEISGTSDKPEQIKTPDHAFDYQVIEENGDCVSFTVTQDQNIHVVVNGIAGLPSGLCRYRMYVSGYPDQPVYQRRNGGLWRITGRGTNQNIYSVFNNVDGASRERRWEVIQHEMHRNGIQEITVLVCGDSDTRGIALKDPHILSPNISTHINTSSIMEVSKQNIQAEGKFLLVIACCSRKISGGISHPGIYSDLEDAVRYPALCEARRASISHHSTSGGGKFMKAWDRYDGVIYRRLKNDLGAMFKINNLIAQGRLDIVIVSALYGLINKDTYIEDYDVAMRQNNLWTHGSTLSESLNAYKINNGITKTVSFLSPTTGYCRAVYYPNCPGAPYNVWPNGMRGANNINCEVADLVKSVINNLYK